MSSLNKINNDVQITNSEISSECKVRYEEDVLDLIEQTKSGDYISIPNNNDISQYYIYKRTDVEDKKNAFKWNGEIRDISWYDPEETIFHIYTAEQLAGFGLLVSNGITFENCTVTVENNIDLNGYSWQPIGSPAYQKEEKKFFSEGVFKGTLNGMNHTIFGLKNAKQIPFYSFAFFMKIENACIENIIFSEVEIESNNVDMIASGVCVISINSTFSNVFVRGTIKGSSVSSISYQSVDCGFYHCKNLANLISNSVDTSIIELGGICSNLMITKQLLNNMDTKQLLIFSDCMDCGQHIIDCKNVTTIYAGHLFGDYLSEDKSVDSIIRKCKVLKRSSITCLVDITDIDTVFFGNAGNDDGESNHTMKHVKKDLLDGLIGRVDKDVNIDVYKKTKSIQVQNMLIPGTMNHLKSKRGMTSFYTVSSDLVNEFDSLYNFEPYFKFIKSVYY